jgi:hypothetical protein
MPPVEPSLRASLLTGASALALSVTNTVAHGQTTLPPALTPPPTWQVWIEGASFSGAGGNFNVPYLPGLGAPYTSFKPQDGIEYAFGVDFAPAGQPYHYVFDFRYGRTGTDTGFASTASSSSSSKFVRVPPPLFFFGSTIFGTQTNTKSNTSTSQVTNKWENHLAADFMFGRELGVGSGAPELLFGVRVADLHAAAQGLMNSQTNTTTNITRTIYSSFVVGGLVTKSTLSSAATAQSFARWNSRFFGAGPRVALTGGVPLVGSWSFEYSGGIAGLIGDRSVALTLVNGNNTGALWLDTGTRFVFNADGLAALSFKFTQNLKVTAGVRADFYNAAITTYGFNTGVLTNVDRLFWGPFVRLTGSF